MSAISIAVNVSVGAAAAGALLGGLRWHRSRTTTTNARIGGSGNIQQIGRDYVSIGQVSTQQMITTHPNSLASGERYIVTKNFPEYRVQMDALWAAATSTVDYVSMYGKMFMPDFGRLKELLDRNVAIRLILLDPDSPEAEAAAIGKYKFSRPIDHGKLIDEAMQIGNRSPEQIQAAMRNEVDETIAMLHRLKSAVPTADLSAYMMTDLPIWKGTIVDRRLCECVIYDVPRSDAPIRRSDVPDIIEFYYRAYFDKYLRDARRIL